VSRADPFFFFPCCALLRWLKEDMKNVETNNRTEISESKWRDLVGGFILAFGEIEFITYRLWNDLFPDQKPPEKFRPRTNLILDYLKASAEKNETVIQLLTDAVGLAEKRNIVAHNPMQVQVYQHTRTGQIMIDHAITCRKTEEYIEDCDLKEFRANAEDLVWQLYLALEYIPDLPQPK
jgi:hypothetical protein